MPPKAVPAQKRRFDSIGLLIQGGEKCGAACFDGTSLLLATNKNQPSATVTKIKDFLHFIADSSYKLSRKSRENEGFDAEYKALKSTHKTKKEEIIQYMKDHVTLELHRGRKVTTFDEALVYREGFLKALNKVTQSIRHTYLHEKSDIVFPKAAVEAIRNNNIIILPRPETKDNLEGQHAELRILQDLITRGKLKEKREYYLGISKRCCRECTHVMAAVNKVKADGIDDIFVTLL